MKKYRKNHTARIPARADAALRHESARSGVEVLLYRLLQSALVQKERRNDLPELTPARARELYEAYRRGEMADVQLMWDQLEERDETLFTVLHARLGALAEMPWAVNIDADLAEDMQPLAEQQQARANELLAAVENLPEALVHLGMADFRGVAALELTGNAARMRWEVIEPWNLCRPVRRGPWYYNAEATATPTRPEELDLSAVIIREAQPIDLPAMFLICAKYLSVHAWDAFLEVFGIPNIFLEMPPATPEEKALEFDAVVQRLIGEGRGTIPNGAKFHTVETSKDNTQSFEARAKWCNEAIIQLATGGLLTVTTQSGSGTLAGNAHSDSFSRLCAASARSISAAINRQFLRPALEAAFPGQPVLVKFEMAPEPVDDRKQMAELLSALNAAGWMPSAETVSEMMNFEVQRIQQPPTAPNTQVPPVMNRADAPGSESPSGRFLRRGDSASEEEDSVESPAESEPPLNEGELAALRALGGELNPEQIAADAEYTAKHLRLTIDDCRLEGSAAAPQDEESPEEEEELATNAARRFYKRDSKGRFDETGAGQHNPRHGKEGRTKAQRNEERTHQEKLPSDSVSKVLSDSDGHQYVRIHNHVKSWEDAEKILSAKIDLAVDKKGAHIKGIPGKGVRAPGMKKEVFITKPGMKSMLSGAHTRRSSDKKAHFSAAASADQLWRTSIFKSEEPDSRTNNPNLKIHRRTAEMRIGKQSYQVLLTAKIYSTKNDVSELHMVEIIK